MYRRYIILLVGFDPLIVEIVEVLDAEIVEIGFVIDIVGPESVDDTICTIRTDESSFGKRYRSFKVGIVEV